MKIIPLTEAKVHLSHYGKLCLKEPVIITVNGKPAFQLAPLDEKDNLIDELLEHNPEFRALLDQRLSDKTLSASEALRRL